MAVFSAKTAVKPLFSNFFSDYSRVLFFGPNDFSCGVNNLRNPIFPPLALFSAETAVKPPFSNFFSDYARVLVFGPNDFSLTMSLVMLEFWF